MSQSRGGVSLTRVRAVSRAVAILRVFSSEEPWLPLRRIAESARLDPGTARRILVTLCDEGLIRQDTDNSRYALSAGVIAIANAAPRGNSLSDVAENALQELARNTHSTAFLSVIREGQLHCLSQLSAPGAIEVRFSATEVFNNPQADYTGAVKLLLAYDNHAGKEAPGSVPTSLVDEVHQIRKQGWNFLKDSPVAGLSALAVPVFLQDHCVAAVSIAGLSPQLTTSGEAPDCLPMLQACRETIEAALQLSPGIEIA